MRILSCLFLALVLLSGCKKEQKLPSGYTYVQHTKSSGSALKAGDFAYYRFQLPDHQIVSSILNITLK